MANVPNSTESDHRPISKKRNWLLLLLGIFVLGLVVYTQFTVFVVQPIGAVPDGATVVIWRSSKLNFIDSADAVCARVSGGVSLLCRGVVLASVAKSNQVLLHLPYSETLYLVSTNGSTYEK